jgi:hypothetical protein
MCGETREDAWPFEPEAKEGPGMLGRVDECKDLVVNALRMDSLREDFDGDGWGALSGA